MNIGLTYDLKYDYLMLGFTEEQSAEFDMPETIDGIENALIELGHKTERIGNIWNLTKKLAEGKKWDLVFNIAEGLNGISRESQVPALLEAYGIPYTFSDPLVLSLSLHKGMTKRVLRDLGLSTADFIEINSLKEIENVKLPYPLFAKPIAEGTSKGISASSIIINKSELKKECARQLALFNQPILLETFLPGREFTVGIIGTGNEARVIGSVEIVLLQSAEQGVYSYNNKENYEEHVRYKTTEIEIADEIESAALKAYRGLGCRDAGRVDIRLDADGVPNIIELNPLAGLNPLRSDLPIICRMYGIKYSELISMIIQSSSKRLPKNNISFINVI